MDIIAKGPDGYYHPSTESELRALVVHAHDARRKLRVRGSAHSVPPAIYASGYDGEGAPPEGALHVILDRYAVVAITPDPDDPRHATAEVEAGCHLGRDPYDPTGASTWANSLNGQLQRHGYALSDVGGISHQTIAGFMSTGSSGGTIASSLHGDIVRLRIIDGTGQIHDLSADDPDPARRDHFFAAGVSMGLLGVISRVWVRVGPTYNIVGRQVMSPTADAPVDLFGDGAPGRPGLARFLQEAPFARLMWWPQRGFRRVQVWQAAPVDPTPGFEPVPYQAFGRAPKLASLAGSLIYTILGNLGDLSQVPRKLDRWLAHLAADLDGQPDAGVAYSIEDVLAELRARFERAIARKAPIELAGSEAWAAARALAAAAGRFDEEGLPSWLATVITDLVRDLISDTLESPLLQPLAALLQLILPSVIDEILGAFVTDGRQDFQDTWLAGLPMDEQMDDELWPTEFTELWIPLEHAAEAMRRLADLFSGDGDERLAFARTGAFSYELYGAARSPFWMSPSNRGPALRINVFWFGLNAGTPNATFFPQFWELLRDLGPLPHWGKHLPSPSDAWRAHYGRHLPRLDAFLALRARLDPSQIFVTEHWHAHLGIAPPGA